MLKDKLDLGSELEIHLLAAMIAVPHFLPMFVGELDPKSFALRVHEAWAKSTITIYQAHHRVPALAAVHAETRRAIGTVGYEAVLPGDVDSVRAGIDSVLATGEDLSYVLDRVREFTRRNALLRVMSRAPEMLENDLTGYEALLKKAMSTGEHIGAEPVFHFGSVIDRIQTRRLENGGRYIPTGIGRLDEFLGGGLRRGRFAVIIAPARGGKSSLLVDICCGALERGHRVLYISHEIRREDLHDRIDTRLTGIPTAFLRDNESVVTRTALDLRSRGGELVIHFWPRGTATIGHYKGLVSKLNDAGFKPDMVVSDYGDLLANPRGVSERRHQVNAKFGDLFQFAQETGLCVWSAMQGNRSSFRDGRVDLDQLAEDWSVAGIVDVAVTVSATEDMEKRGVVRLAKVKDRDRIDGQSAEFGFHRELQRFE